MLYNMSGRMKNQRAAGFVLSYVNIFISSVSGVLFTPYMISSLGSTEYGLYQLLGAFLGYIALLDFGLGSTLTRFILKYKAEENQQKINTVTTMCVKIYCGIGIIVMSIVVFLAYNLRVFFPDTITAENVDYARTLLLLMGLTTSISFVNHALGGIVYAYEKYIFSRSITISRHLARIALIIVFLELNFGAMGIVITDFALTVAFLMIDLFYCKFVLKSKIFLGKWEWSMFGSLFSFSFFVFLQIIVTAVNNGLDKVVLGRFGTLELVALYGVAIQLYSLFNSFGGVVIGITLPKISEVVFKDASKEETTDSCAHYSRYQLHILTPLLAGFIAFGPHFISLWLPDYNPTQVYIITLLIVVPQILESVEGTIFNVMKAKNMQATRSLILIGVAVFHIALSIGLVQIMPVYGTAISTFISFVIGNNIISNIYYHKKVGIDMFRYFKALFKGILPVFVVSTVIGLAINLIPVGGWIGFIVKGTVFVAIYGILVYLFGINQTEKKLVEKIINKLRRKPHVE